MKTLTRNKPEMLRQILRQALVLLEPVHVENVSFAEAVEASLQARSEDERGHWPRFEGCADD